MVAGVVFLSAGLSQQPRSPRAGSAILSNGEELVYVVSWTVFDLGTIRLRSRTDLTAEAYIDSYEDLPFVNLHAVQFTWMDSLFFSKRTRSAEQAEEGWKGMEYAYDLPVGRLIVSEALLEGPTGPVRGSAPTDTLAVPDTNFVDGLSIAYFPRRFVHTDRTVQVPTVLYGDIGTTTFHFPGKPTAISIDALDDPVRVVEVEGNTSLVGIFGMTGAFTGWFSDDAAAVPIKGTLRVLLGTVDIELVSWKRDGWSPPTAG